MREKCSYSELFWSLFSRIRTKDGPEELRIQALFTQCRSAPINMSGSRLVKAAKINMPDMWEEKNA